MRQERDPQQGLPNTPDNPGKTSWKERVKQKIGFGYIKRHFIPSIGGVTVINVNEQPIDDKTPVKDTNKTTRTRTRTTTTRKPSLTREEFESYVQAHNEQEKSSDSRAELVGAGAAVLALALVTGLVGMELGKRIDDEETTQRVEIHVVYPSLAPNTAEPESTPVTLPTIRPTPQPTTEPAQPSAAPTEPVTQDPEDELPLPIVGRPNFEYVLDGWFLIDGDIFVRNDFEGDYIRTYDDLSHTAQQTIAGPEVEVTSLYGFSAYPIAGEASVFDINDERVQEILSTKLTAKLNEGYDIVDVDFIGPQGDLVNVGTYAE
jgi:hypothetical protein